MMHEYKRASSFRVSLRSLSLSEGWNAHKRAPFLKSPRIFLEILLNSGIYNLGPFWCLSLAKRWKYDRCPTFFKELAPVDKGCTSENNFQPNHKKQGQYERMNEKQGQYETMLWKRLLKVFRTIGQHKLLDWSRFIVRTEACLRQRVTTFQNGDKFGFGNLLLKNHQYNHDQSSTAKLHVISRGKGYLRPDHWRSMNKHFLNGIRCNETKPRTS